MDRRRFLAKLSAISAVGLAGCPGGDGGTDTPGETDRGGTPTATPVSTPTGTPTATATAAATPTAEPTDEPTAEPTDEPTDTATDQPPIESDLPRLQTDGKWIVDENGNEVVLRGAATVEPWWAMEYQNQRGADYWESLEMITDRSNGWYPSVLRIPCTINYQEVGISTYAARYLDRIVRHCADNDVYVMIDHHLVRNHDTEETDRLMRNFWNEIAPRYADHSHVIYDIYNESSGPNHWGDDQAAWDSWKEVAQPWVDLVRDHAPDTPLIIGSPRWTRMPHMALEDPFEGDNLIYAGHFYPQHGDPSEMDDVFGAPAEEVPVMMTEFGWEVNGNPQVDRGTTSGWGDPFREWLSSYPNVGWTGWIFDSVWTPRTVDTDWNLLGGDYYAGHFMKRWMYEKRDERTPEAVETDGATYTGPSDESPPPAPTDLSTVDLNETRFEVAWSSVEDDETSVMFYRVYVDGAVVGTAEAETMTIEGTPGESYDIAVTAVDAVSNESDRSETVSHQMEGELQVDAEIPRAGSAPAIDADVDDGWSGVEAREFQHVIAGSVDGDDDLGGTWRAQWDDDAFYVLVDVTDDASSTDSSEHWQDDSLELFVDADNSKGSSYDGTNDFQFTVPRGDGEIGGRLPQDTSTVEWAQTETDAGYRMEFAFPWSVLAVSPSVDHAMGFDAQVNDDDDDSERDAKMAWYGEEDIAWDNPSAFATVQLVE